MDTQTSSVIKVRAASYLNTHAWCSAYFMVEKYSTLTPYVIELFNQPGFKFSFISKN